MTENVAELARELPDAELVFAFVSPLGTPTERLQESLINALRSHGYEVEVVVRISKLLDEMVQAPGGERPAQRQARLMSTGNDLRRRFGGDYLALMAIAAISASRGLGGAGEPRPHRRRAHVIQSLKHPDEVVRLRHVYGKGFFLLGASAPRRVRAEALAMKNFPRDEANALLDKDAAEEERIGQQTRDTFELADAYLRIDELTATGIDAKLMRITDLLFSCPFLVPTREEHAMFLAYAAALRSGDLSRQVGAVVANRFGDVVASGANDVPSARGSEFGGETVAEQVAAGEGSDYRRGFDSNERERNKILVGVIAALVPEEAELPDATAMEAMTPEARATLVKKYKARLEGTGILDLTEFGRAVHAEMAALMSCARSGVTPLGGTLYCTTFPCHNCAKHIVAAGLRSVVYVEPYPKSRGEGGSMRTRSLYPMRTRRNPTVRGCSSGLSKGSALGGSWIFSRLESEAGGRCGGSGGMLTAHVSSGPVAQTHAQGWRWIHARTSSERMRPPRISGASRENVGTCLPMDSAQLQPKIPTFQEVLDGAERAEQRVATWPEWKRELSRDPVEEAGASPVPRTGEDAVR